MKSNDYLGCLQMNDMDTNSSLDLINNKAPFTGQLYVTTMSIAIKRNRYCSDSVNASNTLSYRFALLIYKYIQLDIRCGFKIVTTTATTILVF